MKNKFVVLLFCSMILASCNSGTISSSNNSSNSSSYSSSESSSSSVTSYSIDNDEPLDGYTIIYNKEVDNLDSLKNEINKFNPKSNQQYIFSVDPDAAKDYQIKYEVVGTQDSRTHELLDLLDVRTTITISGNSTINIQSDLMEKEEETSLKKENNYYMVIANKQHVATILYSRNMEVETFYNDYCTFIKVA